MKNRILKGVLRRVFKTSILKIHYFQQDIDFERIKQLLSGFDMSVVKDLNYEDFLVGDQNQFTADKLLVIKNRFSSGDYKAYGISENGHLVYSAWVSLGNLGLPAISTPIPLEPNEGYLEDAYCDPMARGRGFHNNMNNYRLLKLYEMGKNRAIVTVVDGNLPALKTQSRSGFVDMGCFYCGKLFGKEFNTLKKEKYSSK